MSDTFKFLLGWTMVFAVRLLPFRPPNFEPMLSVVMPFSKRFGVLQSFAFGFFGILIYDAVTSGWGIWTAVTAICYGLLGIAAHVFFARREASAWNFVRFGIVATVLYDAVTGLTVGPLAFHQTLADAFIGQIPFTLMHLLGTIVLSAVLSPALYRWVVRDEVPVILAAWMTKRFARD